MSRDRLRRHVEGLGVPAYRAEQMYSWVYQKHVRDPLGMTNLPSTLRESLPDICDFALPGTAAVLKSPDGNTHKFVFDLSGGVRVGSGEHAHAQAAHVLHLEPGGLRIEVRVLRDGPDGADPQPQVTRDRRAGDGHGRLPRLAGRSLQHRVHGHGESRSPTSARSPRACAS
jgi:hypothetical protein